MTTVAQTASVRKKPEATARYPSNINHVGTIVYDGSKGASTRREYHFVEFLGKGGFARVYKCRNPMSGSEYAGKVIGRDSLRKERSRLKLESEIKIHAQLRHPNIVRFYKVLSDRSNYYLMLELCPNRTLVHLIKARGKLTPEETRYFMYHILEGIVYMHDCLVIHRDLKLGNILLSGNMVPKICDFGLASQLDYDGQKRKTICGTPNYIAPEVLNGKTNDGHSKQVDIWSLGVILYTLLIGKPPFETKDVKKTYERIRKLDYTFPEGFKAENPEAAALITAMLTMDPEARPSASEVLQHAFFQGPMASNVTPRIFKVPASKDHFVYMNDMAATKRIAFTEKTNVVSTVGDQKEGKRKRRLPPVDSNQTPKRQKVEVEEEESEVTEVEEVTDPIVVTHRAIKEVLEKVEAKETCTPSPTPPSPPAIWVSKIFDYSRKYGVGFLLSNDDQGIFFNDATVMVADGSLTKATYISRDPSGAPNTIQVNMDNEPEALRKKARLVRQFEPFLARVEEEVMFMRGGKPPKEEVHYIKKWMRTKQAIFLRLSNGSIQINFGDNSALLFTQNGKVLHYLDKYGYCFTDYIDVVALSDIGTPSLHHRLRYARDLLAYLIDNR